MKRWSLWFRFLAARSGNVAVIFALGSFPLLAFTGAAVDYGMATRLQAKLQAATDATALGLCQTPLATTTPQLQAQAVVVSTGYMSAGSGLTIDPIEVTNNPRQITLRTHVPSKTFFPSFTGVSEPTVTATARCATPMPQTFEIALVLDNTGSMAESSGNESKLQAVQQAAVNVVDYVKNNTAFSAASRISIVPFAAAVAVDPSTYATASWVDTKGASSYHWTNVDKAQAKAAGFSSRLGIFNKLKAANSAWGWAGCFEALPYPQSVRDGSPTSNDTLYVPLFAPDEPGNGNNGPTCWDPQNDGNCAQATATTTNSYIDDGSSQKCSSAPGTYKAAENQACKYVNPTRATPGTSHGLPNGPNYQCLSKPLQRLTTSAQLLKQLISNMAPQGNTNIFDGVMWGWRTLSPSSVFGDGAAYNAPTNKVMILMTDGTNTWPGYGSNPNQSFYYPLGYMVNADGSTPASRLPAGYKTPNSDADRRAALDELTQEACTNAKAAGVSIYTIGFSVPSDQIDGPGLQLLKNCASSSQQAFIANDSDGLITAFNKILQSIGSLRISH